MIAQQTHGKLFLTRMDSVTCGKFDYDQASFKRRERVVAISLMARYCGSNQPELVSVTAVNVEEGTTGAIRRQFPV